MGHLRLGLRSFHIVIRVVIEGGRLEHELGLLEWQNLRMMQLWSLVVELPWLVHLGVLLGLLLNHHRQARLS